MDMQVPDSLPRRCAGIEPDVIAVRPQLSIQSALDLINKGQNVARSSSVASHQVAITRRGTTKAVPG